ncbi:carbamoyltransferase HypF [Yinghuangia aomiensis]|uniref:Carbamoyltransferase n=1 Tax=Yinghuangia aomiensis TaxID=676205 RepID=A0ABP9IEJ8_9ACTN
MTLSQERGTAVRERRRVVVGGVVQGVGFRPFVYALATGLGLDGHVTNTGDGVLVEIEGPAEVLDLFCTRIRSEAPPLARVASVVAEPLTPVGAAGFAIAPTVQGTARTLCPPDTATCADCLAELADPADRRHRHPFITCTNCGPRYTIVTGLPYDRAATTMAGFAMCPDCAREYADPADRRFHAQPIACHACGPRLSLVVPDASVREGDAAVVAARAMLADGAILAVKGIGGYHLACDARNPDAVAGLRRRKNRGDKPFAVLARDLDEIAPWVEADEPERALLTGPERPIVLLRRRHRTAPASRDARTAAALDHVAPRCPDLGVMLPYAPVHHLLLGLPGDAPGPTLLVLTSANLSGEPIVTDDAEALDKLAPLVDGWLTHDRPIHVPCDDSVLRVVDGAPSPVRRSRGWAPLPLALPLPVVPSLAVGGDLKCVLALAEGERAWLSGHIGDMDDLATLRAFDRAVEQLGAVTGVVPERVVADLHPRYRSAQRAQRHAGEGLVRGVQHHHAHIASVMAENGLDGRSPVVGVAFDGTGYGTDGAVWGGEILVADYAGFDRFAHVAYVPLPGGDAAVRRPYRMALAHLYAAGLDWAPDLPCVQACPADELVLLRQQLDLNLHCVPTSSMGRLFDAVSSLAGVCHHSEYEAQAAIELEAAALRNGAGERGADGAADGYRFELRYAETPLSADPGPLLAAVAADVRAGARTGEIATRFHTAVADLVVRVCRAARERYGTSTAALSGGVFGNAVLASACARVLRADGFTVVRHRAVPPNDGGLALGQLMVAARAAADEEESPCAWQCPAG